MLYFYWQSNCESANEQKWRDMNYTDLSSRQKLILKAIIEEYTKSSVPVGSKTITGLGYLKCSSTTIRYDMQFLEANEYLLKTHISSGRIPSLKGYEFYLKYILTRDNEVEKMFPIIDTIIKNNQITSELALEEIVTILGSLTPYVVIAIPQVKDQRIAKIDLIQTRPDNGVAIIVTANGKVYHHNFSTKDTSSLREISQVAKLLNEQLIGITLVDALQILNARYNHNDVSIFKDYQNKIVESFIGAFNRILTERVYVYGMINLQNQPEFKEAAVVNNLYSRLDKKNITRLVDSHLEDQIQLGSNISIINDDNITIVCTLYYLSNNECGILGLLGPNRMDYKKIIPLLEYISSKLTSFYKKGD